MNLIFSKNAWEEYCYWIKENKKIQLKIENLLKEISRTPYEGSGKPEPLKYDLSGYWSRRIEKEHRLVYKVQDDHLYILSCRFHY
jgi:toxin YoeB